MSSETGPVLTQGSQEGGARETAGVDVTRGGEAARGGDGLTCGGGGSGARAMGGGVREEKGDPRKEGAKV